MERAKLERMSFDALWSLHVEVTQLLQARIEAEKAELEKRLKAWIANPQQLARAQQASAKLARPDSAVEIARIIGRFVQMEPVKE